MNKAAKNEVYQSRWRGSELESKYLNSKAEFSSKKYWFIPFLFWAGTILWFFVSPATLIGIGLDINSAIYPWLGGTFLLLILTLLTMLKVKRLSYEIEAFWRICETLENLDLYWESTYGSKAKVVFLDRANKKFRSALSFMKRITPPHRARGEIVEKRIRLPLRGLWGTLERIFLPMRSTPSKGIKRMYMRLEELALIFYERDLNSLVEFYKTLEGIPRSHVTKIDIRILFFSFVRSKIGKFIVSFALGNVLSVGLFLSYSHFFDVNFPQLVQEPTGIVGIVTTTAVFTLVIWEAFIRW